MAAKVAVLSIAATIAIFGGLWVQLSLGHDPALGSKSAGKGSSQSSSSSSSSSGGDSSGYSYSSSPSPVITTTS